MTGYPCRTQIAWVAALGLAWLALCSPWSLAWNWLLAVLILALGTGGMLIATRRGRARRHASQAVLRAVRSSLDALPGEMRRNTPLVLAVGEPGALAQAFGADRVRVTDAAVWVRADDAARLAHVADALKRWRDGQGPDAVACLVGADVADTPALHGGLRRWRLAIGEAGRAVGYALPVCVAVYGEEAGGAPDDCPWFGVSGTALPAGDGWLPHVARCLDAYARAAAPAGRMARAHRAARLHTVARLAEAEFLPALRDEARAIRGGPPVHVVATGVIAVAGAPAPDSPFGRFAARITALVGAARQGRREPYPLPEALLRGIAPQPVRRALPVALAHALAWLALAFCAAAAASAWQNRSLVMRITDDMARYRAIAPDRDAARRDALEAIKRNRDELDRYATRGVPLRLGLGFYRGAALRAPLEALIAGYRPPPPPPTTIELDSLSLFRSGSATLLAGSNRALIGALAMIQAHPDKRVLVAGHTDSVGQPRSNLRLSEARALSVRDWLADASGLPPTHFATQGYGDTRPKASNDTEAGRAANRRVEITLVPDCRDGERATSGQPACSFQQKE